MHMFSVQISLPVVWTVQLHPWCWRTLLYSLISSRENSIHLLQLEPVTTIRHFFLYHQVPISVRWTEVACNEKFAWDTSIHDQPWILNPRAFNLEFNALSSQWHTPIRNSDNPSKIVSLAVHVCIVVNKVWYMPICSIARPLYLCIKSDSSLCLSTESDIHSYFTACIHPHIVMLWFW